MSHQQFHDLEVSLIQYWTAHERVAKIVGPWEVPGLGTSDQPIE